MSSRDFQMEVICIPVPSTIENVTGTTLNGQKATWFSKTDESIIYIKLYGDKASQKDRIRIMNALDNYFWRYGKIRDIGRLKEKYSFFGDFFIQFETVRNAKACSRAHAFRKYHDLNPLPILGIYPYQMNIW